MNRIKGGEIAKITQNVGFATFAQRD